MYTHLHTEFTHASDFAGESTSGQKIETQVKQLQQQQQL